MDLTRAETDELSSLPPGSDSQLGESRIDLRLSIAKKICHFFIQNDPIMSADAKAMYEKYPMWGFYLDNGLPKRVYGVADSEEEKLMTLSAMLVFNNATLGGTPGRNLERIDRWTPEAMAKFETGLVKNYGYFTDPLGFLPIINRFN